MYFLLDIDELHNAGVKNVRVDSHGVYKWNGETYTWDLLLPLKLKFYSIGEFINAEENS